ncbi:amidohydrolase [Amylibacter kogurei]|uniref:Amidohydrolase n=1 Tax=Paramylibacter kogurei TaxID=1889778 RepID=A0A2G5KAJ4_9RHOB|nr:carbon-nitrogen hydrolase family protein [Amylibacter kogurei]PIB26537.1 amidohydrolase [Amylibacter kogurei]
MRIGVVQLNSSDNPKANLQTTQDLIEKAALDGAEFIVTPEVTNIVSGDRAHQSITLQTQENDITLRAICAQAKNLEVWVLIGSLALLGGSNGRFLNRSFLINPTGEIAATYDKIHMFDAMISDTESYAESSGYQPGDRAVVTQTDFGTVGLSICYDIRFPQLYRDLAQAGAQIIFVPSAFTQQTGADHLQVLLRARAIETGCFIVAPCQTGTHPTQTAKVRNTYGHSMVIDPWGQVLLDAGVSQGISVLDLDLTLVEKARQRIPALQHDREYKKPKNV